MNKRASVVTGQGPNNDEYKHLIQVNARKFNLFALHEIFLSKQEKFRKILLLDSFLFLGRLAEKRLLTHLYNGIFSHDLPLN